MKSLLPIVLVLLTILSPKSLASVNVTVNGTSYTIPQTNEKGWGNNVTTWIQAISANTLQPIGGTFTLSADVYFGSNFGTVSQYYKSPNANIAGTGILRLNNNSDAIAWRNAGNSADLSLLVNGSNQLTFNGSALGTAASGSFNDSGFNVFNNLDNTKKMAVDASGITTGTTRTLKMANANVDLGNINAATVTTGTLPASVLPNPSSSTIGGVQSAAAVTSNWINSISTSGVPSLSQPAFTDISGTALVTQGGTGTTSNTAYAPIVGGTTSTGALQSVSLISSTSLPLVSNGTGSLPSFQILGLAGGGTGQTTANGALNALLPSQTGQNGNVLTSNGTSTSWTAVLTNPMTTLGDIIYENSTPAATRLAGNTTSTKKFLTQTGTGSVSAAPAWGLIIAGDLAAQGTITTFTTNGTFTTQSSSSTGTIYQYIVIGAGGGGGGTNGASSAGGGGGGGAICYGTFTGVAASTGITITVSNSGGTAGTNAGGSGGTGGSSVIGTPVSVTAAGGTGGTGTTSSLNAAGGSGGACTGGGISITGGAGSRALAAGSANIGGYGAGSIYGSGGIPGVANGGAGGTATGFGAGGGGGIGATASGGAGSPGIIIITQLTP